MNLRTGIDLIEINRLSGLKPSVRPRFLKRVFTPRELAEAGDSDIHLAGRFAAKEAVSKALGTGIGQVSWQEIEIQRDKSGEPVLRLHGNAKRLAEAQGLTIWSVSISHSDAYAVALAVGTGP